MLAIGCTPAPYPKDNPRLTPEQQKAAAAAAGPETAAPAADAPAADAPVEGGETPPPAEGGG